MVEIELKLQVPDAARHAVQAWVAASRARRLRSEYFDTPERDLAAAGLALRIRREGRVRVQALKASGADAIHRFEHEAILPPSAAALPMPALHAGTEAGDRLLALLAARGAGAKLVPQIRSDIERRTRMLRLRGGRVEVAWDCGEIVAGAQRRPVHELEIELLAGDVAAPIALARRLVVRHGLWLDPTSKAERGEHLLRGLAAAPAPRACAVQLDPAMDAEAALRAVLANCLSQILPNAAEIAGGIHGDEHLHQLRVGLRRLRTALRLFSGWAHPVPAAWSERLAALFRGLGAARDRDAIAASLLPLLRAAAAPLADLPASAAAIAPPELMRSGEANTLWLELLARRAGVGAPAWPPAAVLAEAIAARLARWHRRVVRGARRWSRLTDAERHRLRRRVKRLRYAAEFSASLHRDAAVARYLERLAPAQDCLGRYNDLCVAIDLYRDAAAQDPRAWFAVGWLTARRESLSVECGAVLAKLDRARPFWGRG